MATIDGLVEKKLDEKGMPTSGAYDKVNPAVIYSIMNVVFTAVGLGLAYAIHSTNSDAYDAKIATLKAADLGYAYLAVYVLQQTLFAQQIFVALGRKKSHASNPDQYIYETVGRAGEPYVRLVTEGAVGEFNRAQRGIDNTREGFPMILAQVVLAGFVYPKVVLAISVVYFFARCLYSHGYIKGAASRMPGQFMSMLSTGVVLGSLNLFVAIKAVM